MTVSFFLKKGGGLKDAVLYGLSIVILYVGLGLLVTVLFGASALNEMSTNAVVNIVFFLILVIFALSFFGLFEITLPDSWSTALDSKARSTGGFFSILLMAFTLVIVSFSCTGPIIGTLLVEAAGKSLLAPAMGMLGFAIALALPFSLFAMFPQWLKQAPKSGDWMTSFKVVLAFLELALSLKFLSVADLAYGWGILPRWLFLAIWIVCFAGIGVYLLHGISKVDRVRQWIRVLVIVPSMLFAAYLVPGLWGAPVKAVSAFADVSVEAVSTADNGEKIDELIEHLQETSFPWKIETDKRNKTSMEEKRKKCRSGWGTAPVGGPVRYTVTLEDNSVKTYASANRMVMELSPNGRFLEVEGHICTEGWDNLDIDGDMVFQRSETGECSRKRVPISEFVWRKPLPCSGDQAKHCSLCGNMSLYEIPEH
jgi:hypothetical protein